MVWLTKDEPVKTRASGLSLDRHLVRKVYAIDSGTKLHVAAKKTPLSRKIGYDNLPILESVLKKE